MADTGETTSTEMSTGSTPPPEFRIVVRRPHRGGPLAAYRFPIAIAVVLIVFGTSLWTAVWSGAPDDGLLIRAAVLGLLVWVTTGIVSSALGAAGATPGRRRPDDPST